jgi:cytochrome b6-f complex iron-sulfur subunit
MAKRPSVKEILEAARRGGPANPSAGSEPPATAPEGEVSEAAAHPETPGEAAAPADIPTPSSLGRPLTLQEKLAAARAGGKGPAPAAKPAAAKPAAKEAPAVSDAGEAAPAAAPPPKPAAPLGRPMTLQEKLAAARGGGATPAAGTGGAAPAAKPAAAKPAAKAAPRALPPLEEMTDPRDLAEALRQTGAKKTQEAAARAAAANPKPAPKPAAAKPQTVLPRPTREATAVATAPEPAISRRGLLVGSMLVSWVLIAWTTFTAAVAAMTAMTVRFMFPNVLAEPPTTIKIGLPTKYEPEEVNDSFKAEWGFWVVRSTRYNGQDIIYALQSVCTHLGCPPNWLANEQKFKCPCHGSGFYISGINFEGPAPRPLERFKVALADDGQIVVDKSQKFQEELQQWSDPDSFVPA